MLEFLTGTKYPVQVVSSCDARSTSAGICFMDGLSQSLFHPSKRPLPVRLDGILVSSKTCFKNSEKTFELWLVPGVWHRRWEIHEFVRGE